MTRTGNCEHHRHHTCRGGGTFSRTERVETKNRDGKPSGKFHVEKSHGTYLCDCDCHRNPIVVRDERETRSVAA